jgi:hypothetical protein
VPLLGIAIGRIPSIAMATRRLFCRMVLTGGIRVHSNRSEGWRSRGGCPADELLGIPLKFVAAMRAAKIVGLPAVGERSGCTVRIDQHATDGIQDFVSKIGLTAGWMLVGHRSFLLGFWKTIDHLSR